MAFFKYAFSRSRHFERRRPLGAVSYFAGGRSVTREEQQAYFAANRAASGAEPVGTALVRHPLQEAVPDAGSSFTSSENRPLAA